MPVDRLPLPKIFVCTFGHCGKAFARKSDTKRHEGVHLKREQYKYECPTCLRRFNQSSNMTSHYEAMHKGRMHACGIDGCKEERRHRASLSRHRGEAHGVEEDTEEQVATYVSAPAPAPPTFACSPTPSTTLSAARNIHGHHHALDVEFSFRSRDRQQSNTQHTWGLASTRPFDAPSRSISTTGVPGLYRYTRDHVERLPRVVPSPPIPSPNARFLFG